MTTDIEVLRFILLICLAIAAIFTTAFPVLYLFSPWYASKLGRLFMLQSVSYALALDMTLLFAIWQTENLLLRFSVTAIVFCLLAVSSAALTWMLWRTNHSKWSWHRSHQPRKSRFERFSRLFKSKEKTNA